jgi:hypothetical protein
MRSYFFSTPPYKATRYQYQATSLTTENQRMRGQNNPMTCPEEVAIRKVFTNTTSRSAFTSAMVQLVHGFVMMLTTSIENALSVYPFKLSEDLKRQMWHVTGHNRRD